jgi:hypothetical protein
MYLIVQYYQLDGGFRRNSAEQNLWSQSGLSSPEGSQLLNKNRSLPKIMFSQSNIVKSWIFWGFYSVKQISSWISPLLDYYGFIRAYKVHPLIHSPTHPPIHPSSPLQNVKLLSPLLFFVILVGLCVKKTQLIII